MLRSPSYFIIKLNKNTLIKILFSFWITTKTANSCVLALKFKQNAHGLWFCLQFQGFQFSNWPLI
jgi:hypothetical protein